MARWSNALDLMGPQVFGKMRIHHYIDHWQTFGIEFVLVRCIGFLHDHSTVGQRIEARMSLGCSVGGRALGGCTAIDRIFERLRGGGRIVEGDG